MLRDLAPTEGRTIPTNVKNVIHRFKCSQAGCKEEYIGELGRSFADRLKNILGAPAPYMSMVSHLDTVSMCTVFL